MQHFIYPLSATSGFRFDDTDSITPENFWPFALRGETTEWRLASGFRLVQPGDLVWAYFGGDTRFIAGVGVVAAPVDWSEEWSEYSILIAWDPDLTKDLADAPIPYEAYRQHVRSAMPRANAGTRRVLERWLRTRRAGTQAGHDVAFVRREVAARLGQPQFRSAALRAYGGACAITGCTETAVLQASHIVPVSAKGRHDIANSVILRADVHNLFDLGLLWVDDKLRVAVSDALKDRGYRKLAGTEIATPVGASRTNLKRAYAAHRQAHGI